MREKNTLYDAVIVGAGAAGLSAAFVLGRSHRKVLVIDEGDQSNLVSNVSHGVFTRDGVPPARIYEIAGQQLQKYKAVTRKTGKVSKIEKNKDFTVTFESKTSILAKTIVLAQGIHYDLPEIAGARELFGTKVWHCPFCEGFEATGKRLLAVGDSEWIKHMNKLLPSWSQDITWRLIGETTGAKPAVEGKFIGGINQIKSQGEGVAVIAEDEELLFDQVVMQTIAKKRDGIADSLGCKRNNGKEIKTSSSGETSVSGIFCAGDQTAPINQVNVAVASGHAAGMGVQLYLAGE